MKLIKLPKVFNNLIKYIFYEQRKTFNFFKSFKIIFYKFQKLNYERSSITLKNMYQARKWNRKYKSSNYI